MTVEYNCLTGIIFKIMHIQDHCRWKHSTASKGCAQEHYSLCDSFLFVGIVFIREADQVVPSFIPSLQLQKQEENGGEVDAEAKLIVFTIKF